MTIPYTIKSKKIIKILLLYVISLNIIAFSWLSCNDLDLYEFSYRYSHYGPVWSLDATGTVMTVTYPDDVENADEMDNYDVIYSGTNGNVQINTIVPVGTSLQQYTVYLTLSSTDGSSFYIKLINSVSPIMTAQGINLTGCSSPSFATPSSFVADTTAPQVYSYDDSTVPGGIMQIGVTYQISITFTEDVANTLDSLSYQAVSGGGAIVVTLSPISYDNVNFTVILEVTPGSGSGNTFYIEVTNAITDTSTNQNPLQSYTSPVYTIN